MSVACHALFCSALTASCFSCAADALPPIVCVAQASPSGPARGAGRFEVCVHAGRLTICPPCYVRLIRGRQRLQPSAATVPAACAVTCPLPHRTPPTAPAATATAPVVGVAGTELWRRLGRVRDSSQASSVGWHQRSCGRHAPSFVRCPGRTYSGLGHRQSGQ